MAMSWKIEVDEEKCTGCGECIEACPADVYTLVDGKSMVTAPNGCHGCHTCEAVCPTDACLISDAA